MSPPCHRPLAYHARSPVPTSWFRTTSSVFSARSRGLVASRCQSWGSPRFRFVPPVSRLYVPSPRRSYPSKDSTHPQPYRVTTAYCLLDVHTSRCSRLQGSRCRSRPSARFPLRARLQGFALRVSPYHRPTLPPTDGLPSRGLFDPLQGPSFMNHQLSPTILDGRPVRLRGSVSVPIVPAPADAIAAPLSDR